MKFIGLLGHKDIGRTTLAVCTQRPTPPLIRLDAADLARLGVRLGETAQLLLPADELLALVKQYPADRQHLALPDYLYRERGRLVTLVPAGAAVYSLFRFITS